MENLIPYIASIVTSLVVGGLVVYVQPSAKVVFWSPHSFYWPIVPDGQDEAVPFQTDLWTIQNIGRRKATNLDILFERQPDHWQLQPAIVHDTKVLENGQFAIRIAELAKNEVITVAVFSWKKLPKPLSIKTDVGLATAIDIGFERRYGPWMWWTRAILIVLGFATVAYWAAIGAYRFYSCMNGCVL